MKHNLDLKKLFELAFENHKNGNLPVAEKFYKQILNQDSEHFDSNFYLSALFMQIKKFDEAKVLIQKGLKIQPKNVDLYNALGLIFNESKNFEESIKY